MGKHMVSELGEAARALWERELGARVEVGVRVHKAQCQVCPLTLSLNCRVLGATLMAALAGFGYVVEDLRLPELLEEASQREEEVPALSSACPKCRSGAHRVKVQEVNRAADVLTEVVVSGMAGVRPPPGEVPVAPGAAAEQALADSNQAEKVQVDAAAEAAKVAVRVVVSRPPRGLEALVEGQGFHRTLMGDYEAYMSEQEAQEVAKLFWQRKLTFTRTPAAPAEGA